MRTSDRLGRVPLPLIAGSVALLLTLGGCAENQPAENQPQEQPGIIWNSDRATPTPPLPAAPGPAPGQPLPDQSAAPSPAPTGSAPSGSADGCREYTDTVTIGGISQEAHGRACPQPDGSWWIDMPSGSELPQLTGPSPLATTGPFPIAPFFPSTGGSVFFGSSVFVGDRPFRPRRFPHRRFPDRRFLHRGPPGPRY